MKKIARIFIILGMVFTFYLIFPIIVGIIALDKLENAKSRDDLMGIGVCTALFCSLIGGILMLCMTDDDLNENRDKNIGENIEQKKTNDNADREKKADTAGKLLELKKMLDDGIISQEVFEEKKEKYLNDMFK